MGTNYYAHIGCCDKCGRPDRKLHIGKSSYGWAFLLATHPLEGIHDWPDWERELAKPGVRIINEYGDNCTLDDLRNTVTNRPPNPGKSNPGNHYSWFDEKTGLMRNRGPYCAKNGEGTWDCVIGEFS